MPHATAGATESLLPLSEVVWEVLLALTEQDRHGYAVLVEVEHRTQGRLRLLPGSLYRALNRLHRDRLIVERTEHARDGEDPRRRVYRLTALGRRVAAAEARRLAAKVDAARRHGLLAPQEQP